MRVKICGITRLEDALICAKLGVDAVGFIFYKKSKRYISPESASEIISKLPAFIQKVGVFVDEDPKIINQTAEKTGITIAQLHGDEQPETISQINIPVIKAFRVSLFFNYDILYRYKKTPILLDGYDSEEKGGTGKSFEWKKIPAELRSEIILAGGVNETNVEKIAKEINPAAIDISSSVEISPGIKDTNKLIKLMNKINQLRYLC
ncbi:MAG: phosphoribosylanthranilate isomerase [Rhodothermaceae bacterium]